MAGALEDCLVVAGGLEAVEPKRKVFLTTHKIDQVVTSNLINFTSEM